MSRKLTLSIIGIIILGFFAAYLWGVSRRFVQETPLETKKPSVEKVTLKTSDAVTIAAEYYPPKTSSTKGVLLVHMMPQDRTSWRQFAPTLSEKGYHTLAIDLRGHGESDGGPTGYQRFSDADHKKSILDLEAGAEFLKSKGARELSLIGASIGANLSLQFMAEHPEAKNGVFLSPGLNYHGIEAAPRMRKLTPGQRLLLVGSNDDSQSDGEVLRGLIGSAEAGVETKPIIYKRAGHGTNMFGKESPDLAEEILNWLK